MDAAHSAAAKQRGRPFAKGVSGNPAGKPQGTRNKATRAMEALLDGEAEALTRKAIELALGGDGPALRLCLERVLPPRRDRPVTFDLPDLQSVADVATVAGGLLQSVSQGDITPAEAAEVGKLVDAYVRAVEASQFEERLARLEERSGQ